MPTTDNWLRFHLNHFPMKPTVRAAKEAISKLYRAVAIDPSVVEARKAYIAAEDAAMLAFKPLLDAARADLHNAQRVKAEPRPTPALLVPIITRLNAGVDWSGRWRCNYINSEYDRAIISLPSRTFFGGIGMRSRAQSEYHLIDLKKANDESLRGLSLSRAITLAEWEGRLPALVADSWRRFCDGAKTFHAGNTK